MTISFVGSTTYHNATPTQYQDYTLPMPAGLQSGDVVVVMTSGYTTSTSVLYHGSSATASPYQKGATGGADGTYGTWSALADKYDGGGTLYRVRSDTTSGYSTISAVVLVYRGVDAIGHVAATSEATSTTTAAGPSFATTTTNSVIVGGWAAYGRNSSSLGSMSVAAPSGFANRGGDNPGDNAAVWAGDRTQATVATVGPYSTSISSSYAPSTSVGTFGMLVELQSLNTAPNAPALNSPATNATIDRSITQRFAWTFSDPDAGDSQSKFDLRYRVVNTTPWTTVSGTTPNAFYDFAAGTFAAGNYEWQVRTYDSQGVVGPWSSSSFFTAADGNDAPTITAPTSGSTVSNTAPVTWSAPNQTDYQVRRVADNAGAANTSIVYYDSGDVVSSTTRSVTLTFDTNNRYEHIQVRYKYNGLWSSWADVRVQVSYTAPAKAIVTLWPDPDGGSLAIGWSNPAPSGGQPSVSYVDILIDDDDGLGELRRATLLPTNSSWVYRTPRSGVDYDPLIRVRSVATNGVVSYSDPATETPVYTIVDGGNASASGSGVYDGGTA